MQALLYSCGRVDEDEIRGRFDAVLQSAHDGRASIATLDSLYPLQDLVSRVACPPLTATDARKLTSALLDNPAYAFWEYQVHILFHSAWFANEEGEHESALAYLTRAEALGPTVMPILQLQVHILMEQGRYNDAIASIERRRTQANRNRFMSDSALDDLAKEVQSHSRKN